MIAWCSQPGHGTRIFPPGTITGVQLTKTPDYVQVVGFMDQTKVDMVQGDSGGEMDPHGADLVSLIWRMMGQSADGSFVSSEETPWAVWSFRMRGVELTSK
jgi:hypothetical protein